MQVVLEDNKTYNIIDEILINNQKYIYLCSDEDYSDVCVRKLTDNETMLSRLDSEEEYKLAIKAFTDKHKDTICAA